MSEDIWGYRPTAGYQQGIDLVGYKVEASDGHIGKIDKHSEDVGSSYLVVDTGVWIFGKRVLLPAGVIERIDTAAETVYVNRTKDQIKDAPEFDEAKHAGEPTYLEQFRRYYGQPHM
ncbi:PRC-barrel domain containing protein [Streptomyces sp. ISL-1]|uniref:PRC-barrel domain-containing protein n=1 Tax=Streptomyces sp. ISL-1 TaxID=2817657 RepID=UPI001BEC09E7|nr:PRC-barrel domain-containing protein [Streptomyces sp. ISL-1]MBT2394255.1 PRC-barrel domain containing protein [Streptomyces sp. ISL-1]